ncbi:MAG: hypothetical protein EOO70_07135 [Myxococcaceae bacterium]|nr:MAG: hypothetical protein EOO70_07135 [Myxococcaceae bacterium]
MEDRYRAYSYLGNALLLPSGRFTHIWSGYNRWTLKRMQSDALRYARVRLRLDLSKFPKKLQVGKIVHYGLGGP